MSYPPKIYHWLDTQLSVARFAGGCVINGERYRIAYEEEGQPLVKCEKITPKPAKLPKTRKNRPETPPFPGFN